MTQKDDPQSAHSKYVIEAGTSIATVLKNAPLEPLENRLLVMHALQLTRTQLITQDQRIVDAEQAVQLSDLFQRRLQGEPIAYILGQREFFGLMLEVTPDVLIPRPDTELLVELGLERLPAGDPHPTVLDLGTGSGAIAIAIAHTRPDAIVTAIDVSAAALIVARRNAEQHLSANIASFTLLESDWYAALGEQRFDLIVANPPYIVKDDHHLSQGDLRFEPINALTDHADGLSAYRIIINGALQHLSAGGWLLMEHGYDQAPAVQKLLQALPFEAIQSWHDLAGIERVTGGRFQPAVHLS
ncbi:peptide chain release factor N(5)-glutamine methyltransferase [Glaciimonas sp. PCH181]|uniref:peptide chain release factor N(5)-glutamine methyltransferase n=1 Tax=Glaciimonas sp. PCH181 TaxID=2133943 RepID=UPI000D388AF3|nr:peptide chain release factor N(5)-glutamine methyltransferase [Glaciimonas sp. PCH181]PUA16365.1 peptide chain release factor N(5)-glutamine methyltransferase [Glaciimonas sp. PCH181]